jgi:LysR family transcriptional activator of glutamate synthase operon
LPGIKRLFEISVQDHRLRYLSLAAQHGSMRAAADLIGIAPSSISRQIGQLERDLKIDLVEKGSHKIRLTAAGELLIEYHNQRTTEHGALLSRLSELRNAQADSVRLAIGEGLLTKAMMTGFADVTRQHAKTVFECTTASSAEVQQMILSDIAEIGVVFETADDVRLRIRVSIEQPVRLIARADAPISRQPVVELADIVRERLVMPGATHRLSEIVNSVLRNHELVANVVLSSNSLGTILDSVRAGLGVALMPEILAARDIAQGELVSRPIACADFDATRVHIVTRNGRGLSPPAVALLSALSRDLNKTIYS